MAVMDIVDLDIRMAVRLDMDIWEGRFFLPAPHILEQVQVDL
jgi:hypothetical protein